MLSTESEAVAVVLEEPSKSEPDAIVGKISPRTDRASRDSDVVEGFVTVTSCDSPRDGSELDSTSGSQIDTGVVVDFEVKGTEYPELELEASAGKVLRGSGTDDVDGTSGSQIDTDV